MPTVITLGEMLIDLISTKSGESGDSPGFYKCPGGAPANVAVGVSRLGVKSGFIGKLGDDEFGYFLKNVLEANKVDTSNLLFTKEAQTAIAFVSLTAEGERDFLFYRKPCADKLLSPQEINEYYISSARILHFGSLSLAAEPAMSATFKAIEYAKQHGLIISMDPNIRLSLWDSKERARNIILQATTQCNLLKLSEEEARFLSDEYDLKKIAEKLLGLGPDLVVITLGGRGCLYKDREGIGKIKGYSVKVQDTTGAGDGFTAGFLAYLVKKDLVNNLGSLKEIDQALHYANAVAAMVTTEVGAIPVDLNENRLQDFIERHKFGEDG